MNNNNHELAVVLPAYKARHFEGALVSLRNQRDKRFTVYIGDDASTEPIQEIAAKYSRDLQMVYTRFPENLGKTSLVAHWHRCIELSSEPWIWLFSDDDIAEPGCTSAFFEQIASRQGGVELYRFNLAIIDADSNVASVPGAHPIQESAEDLLLEILTNRVRQWRAPDHIFARSAFVRHHGFQEFPAALFSDSATWIKFAHPSGVITLAGARLLWRAHSQSVSAQTTNYRKEYLLGLKQFSHWVLSWSAGKYPNSISTIETNLRSWFFKQTSLLCGELSRIEYEEICNFANSTWKSGRLTNACHILRMKYSPKLRRNCIVSAVVNWRHRQRMRRHAASV